MKRSKCEHRGEGPSTPAAILLPTSVRIVLAITFVASAYAALLGFAMLAAAPATAAAPVASVDADDTAPTTVDDKQAKALLEEFRARLADRTEELDVLETVRRIKLVDELSKSHAHEDIAAELGNLARNRRHDDKRRVAAARGLGRYAEADEATRERAAKELLRSFPREDAPSVLEAELRSLGKLRCEKAVRAIGKKVHGEWSKQERHTQVLEAAIRTLGDIGSYEALEVLHKTWTHFAKIEESWAGGRQKTAVDRLTGAHAKKGSSAASGTPNPLVVIPEIRDAIERITEPVFEAPVDSPRELKKNLRQIRAALKAKERTPHPGGATAPRG